jgi:uncharacterized protein
VTDKLLGIVNVTRGTVLAERARLAESFLGRARGLLGQATLPAGEGLVIRPCQVVHTFGMAFPIDVIHLDGDGRVVKILAGLPPHRLGPLVWRSCAVVELPQGTAATTGTLPDDVIQLDPAPDP